MAPVARTLIDLAADPAVGDDLLRGTAQDLLRIGRGTSGTLLRDLPGDGVPGTARLRDLLATGALDVESQAEWELLRDVLRAHPPEPDAQVWAAPGWRVDFMYVFAALAIEYYGLPWHRGRVDEDARRVHGLERAGVHTIIVTKGVRRDPEGLMAHVHELRRHREREILAGRLARPALPVQRDRRLPLRTTVPLG